MRASRLAPVPLALLVALSCGTPSAPEVPSPTGRSTDDENGSCDSATTPAPTGDSGGSTYLTAQCGACSGTLPYYAFDGTPHGPEGDIDSCWCEESETIDDWCASFSWLPASACDS